MKILFVTKELPYPIDSGHRMRSWHYLKGLVSAGEVTLAALFDQSSNQDGAKAAADLGVKLQMMEEVSHVSEKSIWRSFFKRLLSLFSKAPYSVKTRTDEKLKDALSALILQEEFDVIVCDGIHLAWNIPFFASGYKVLLEHNVESVLFERFSRVTKNIFKKFYALLEWKKFIVFENQTWRHFDEIHVCSKDDQSLLLSRAPEMRVFIVPNGIVVDDIEASKKEYRRRLIYTGLIHWQPNQDAVLYFANKIYPLIKERVPDIEFFVVGKGPAACVLNLQEKDPTITVTGAVDEIKPYILESAVFVVPLRIGSGTRLKILEAMALQKAVVSTSIGCEGLDVHHGQDILIADRPEGFADCVVDLLNDQEKRKVLAQAGRSLVEEKYDWKNIERQIVEIYKKLYLHLEEEKSS